MPWCAGEYAARIDNAADLLEGFVEHFQEENAMVQLQLLTGRRACDISVVQSV